MVVLQRFNTKIHPDSEDRHVFSVSVTDINQYEIVNNESNAMNSSGIKPEYQTESDDYKYAPGSIGSEYDLSETFISASADKIKYSYALKGFRSDFKGNSLLNTLIPVNHSGHVPKINIGDTALIQTFFDGHKPVVIGAMHSKSGTWDDAVLNFERPAPPSIELRGSHGNVETYNPIYLTYHPNYEPSELYFGEKEEQILYDRFILFESSDIYRNKKNLIDYNKWILTSLEKKEKGISDIVLKLIEDPINPRFMDSFFYLDGKNYPIRPDPVFDVNSNYHISKIAAPILSTKSGVSFFDATGLENFDKYPVILSNVEVESSISGKYSNASRVKYTAYDEVLNGKLKEIREKATLRTEKFHSNKEFLKFKPDLANKSIPFEFKESREIKIGRNKLVLADVYGDQTQLFSTFKTAKDQGLTMLYHTSSSSKIGQVRLRNHLGDSFLIESESEKYSRLQLKGVSGQIFEMYDSVTNDQNFIYSVTSDASKMTQSWSLQQGSWNLIANKSVPKQFKRLLNIDPIDQYNSITTSTGKYSIMGTVNEGGLAFAAMSVKNGKTWTDIFTEQGSGYIRDIRRVKPGISEGVFRASGSGGWVNIGYSSAEKRWQVQNSEKSTLEVFGLDIDIKSESGTIKTHTKGIVSTYGENGVYISSKTVGINAPMTYIGISSVNVPAENIVNYTETTEGDQNDSILEKPRGKDMIKANSIIPAIKEALSGEFPIRDNDKISLTNAKFNVTLDLTIPITIPSFPSPIIINQLLGTLKITGGSATISLAGPTGPLKVKGNDPVGLRAPRPTHTPTKTSNN